LLIWLGIRRSMRPLRVLNNQIENRAPTNLAPVEIEKAPAEVAPLVGSLNRLFERVQASIENERRFTADAAHELRTPLAALRAQAQVARGSTDDAERRHALDKIVAACDRASHLVAQLLTLARLEPQDFHAARDPCDLRAVLQHTMADIAPAAVAKGIELELEDGPAAIMLGDVHLLDVLFRNLIDNAVRYSPPRSHVLIRVDKAGSDVSVIVADEGPGIPIAERDKLGRRFHRLAGNEATGTGLGLSIAQRIAELHYGRIAFDEAAGGMGLAVSVQFQAAA
jgi:two-component system sensor histidine kinase QseC